MKGDNKVFVGQVCLYMYNIVTCTCIKANSALILHVDFCLC